MNRRHHYIGDTRIFTMSAMFTAMSIVMLYLSVVFPNMKMTFFFLSSVFVMGILVEGRVLPAVLSYVATSLLSLVLMPIGYALPYILLFGHYGIMKYIFEDRMSTVGAYIAKLIYFDVFMAVVYLVAVRTGLLGLGEILGKLPIWAIALIAQPVFFAYDFLFGKVVVFYVNNIRKFFVRR